MSDLWAKALHTERQLRAELAWFKRLPLEVTKKRTFRNLVKLLLRVKKLFAAKSSAAKILRALQTLKSTLRGEYRAEDIYSQAQHLRSMLITFRSDQKIFGSEFMFEDIDLYSAFEKIRRVIMKGNEDHTENIRLIKNALMFFSDILRESCDTMLVQEIPIQSLVEEEEKEPLFEDLALLAGNKTIRAYTELRESHGLNDAESAYDTVQLSIEHVINFDISGKKLQSGLISQRVNQRKKNDEGESQILVGCGSVNPNSLTRNPSAVSNLNPVSQEDNFDKES